MTLATGWPKAGSRRAGGCGLAFVLLLLIGAGMASVPGGSESVPSVRDYYEEHARVVVVSQAVELVATLPLICFLRGLAASPLVRAKRAAVLAGGTLVLASILTLVPPLLLVVRHDDGSSNEVHAWAVLADLTDVLLFAAIAAFAISHGWAGTWPPWLRWLALLVGCLAAVRAVAILLEGVALELAAPLAFIVLVIVLSILMLRQQMRAATEFVDHR